MTKSLCKYKSKQLSSDQKLMRLIDTPKFACMRCSRVANKKQSLCRAMPLTDVQFQALIHAPKPHQVLNKHHQQPSGIQAYSLKKSRAEHTLRPASSFESQNIKHDKNAKIARAVAAAKKAKAQRMKACELGVYTVDTPSIENQAIFDSSKTSLKQFKKQLKEGIKAKELQIKNQKMWTKKELKLIKKELKQIQQQVKLLKQYSKVLEKQSKLVKKQAKLDKKIQKASIKSAQLAKISHIKKVDIFKSEESMNSSFNSLTFNVAPFDSSTKKLPMH